MRSWSVLRHIAPAVAAVFGCFVAIGATIGAIPLYVSGELGFGSSVVGLVVAVQYLAMLLARPAAGKTVDGRGPNSALKQGMFFFLLCVVGYIASGELSGVGAKLAALVSGRLFLGIAESYIVTGALAWAMARVGAAHAGMVMSWNGNAMYGGIAAGAPLASMLGSGQGFSEVAWVSGLLLGISALAVLRMEAFGPLGGTRPPFRQTLMRVSQPGFGLLLASVGYGTVLGFGNLYFHQLGWSSGPFAISGFGLAYVTVRVFYGWLPDRYGGARVALGAVLVEAIGQALLFWGPNEYLALLGTILSGAGFSLAVPAFGVEAVRRVSAASRGAAMAGYLAFFDLSFGIAIPLAGVVADATALATVYLLGVLGALCGVLVAMKMAPIATSEVASFESQVIAAGGDAGGE